MKALCRRIVTARFLPGRGACAALLIAASAVGCAGLREKEELAFNAGFRMVAPIEPRQQAILAKLSTGQLIQTSYRGRIYYVLPDPNYGQAYVGGRSEYQAYLRLRRAQGLRVEVAPVNQSAAMDWSALNPSADIAEWRK